MFIDSFLCYVTAGSARPTLGNPVATDADGLLIDVDVQPVNDKPSMREDKRQDIDEFFHPPVIREANGKSKKYSTCKLCLWVYPSVTIMRIHKIF